MSVLNHVWSFIKDTGLFIFVILLTGFLMCLLGAAIFLVAQAIFMKSIFLGIVAILVYFAFYKIANWI